MPLTYLGEEEMLVVLETLALSDMPIPAWGEMRALGHRMIDDMMDYLQSVRERPAWQPVPAGSRAVPWDAGRSRH